MAQNMDVVIVGGGAVGVCSAYYLNEAGHDVTLIERRQICSGSSHGNAGLIVPSHSIPLAAPGIVAQGIKWMFDPESPFYIKPRLDLDLISWLWRFWLCSTKGQVRKGIPLIRDLSYASLQLFDDLSKLEGADFGLHKKGMLDIFDTQAGLDAACADAELLVKNGLAVDVLTPAQVKNLIPELKVNTTGAVHHKRDGHIKPQKFVADISQHLKRNGVDVRENTEVIGFETRGASIKTVQTTRGTLHPKEIVLTAGSWSNHIGTMLNLSLPIQPAKGYSVTVQRPDKWPEMPMVLAEAKVGVTPMMDTLRFAGTLELAGFDESVNQRRVDAILKAVPRYLPEVDVSTLETVEVWRGLRPCTPDGLPFLGRPSSYENLVLAAGHAMIGVSLSPVTGKLVSQLIAGEQPIIEIGALHADRFN
ncbi:MAG: FAD-dependent oxidoreductase [Gemmatimonadota bacterium]|nr:FAD-dependent oxidoreductase [Gemmatimonadota bacterium]